MREGYHRLGLYAKCPDTEIWIGDERGMFVAKGVGMLTEGLMPGTYMVTFGKLGESDKLRVELDGETVIWEKDLEPTDPRYVR